MNLKNILRQGYEFFKINEGGRTVGVEEAPNFDKSFLILFSTMGIIFSVVSVIVNFIWSFTTDLKILVWFTFAFYILIFLLAKKGKKINLIKWVFIISMLAFVNFAWYNNYRANGPILYLLFIIYAYFIFWLDNKQIIFVSVLLVLNIGALYYLESRNIIPDMNYPNTQLQRIDAYLSVMLYLLVAFVLMRFVKRNYLREYHRAIESDRLKTSFLTNMSHEIRTPLNAIVGFSNLILLENITPEQRSQYKLLIEENNKELLELVNNIMDISMIESHNLPLNTEPANLNKLMAELEKNYLALLLKQKKGQVKLVMDVPQNDVVINIDKDHLQRTLKHLLDNAVKFTEKGAITFGYSLERKSIRFLVKDTGPGIKHSDLKSLFKAVNKMENGDVQLYSKTGIGLYLVKLIVEMFGGEVFVHSVYGEGSEFGFTLPSKEFGMKIEEKTDVEN